MNHFQVWIDQRPSWFWFDWLRYWRNIDCWQMPKRWTLWCLCSIQVCTVLPFLVHSFLYVSTFSVNRILQKKQVLSFQSLTAIWKLSNLFCFSSDFTFFFVKTQNIWSIPSDIYYAVLTKGEDVWLIITIEWKLWFNLPIRPRDLTEPVLVTVCSFLRMNLLFVVNDV